MKFGVSGSTFDGNIDEGGEEFNPIYKQGSVFISIDRFLVNINIKEINFLKIDVDGNELNVIKGME